VDEVGVAPDGAWHGGYLDLMRASTPLGDSAPAAAAGAWS
jgi:hypothetical protein